MWGFTGESACHIWSVCRRKGTTIGHIAAFHKWIWVLIGLKMVGCFFFSLRRDSWLIWENFGEMHTRGGLLYCNCGELVSGVFWVWPSRTRVICRRSPVGADAAKDRSFWMVCVEDTAVRSLVGHGRSRWLFWLSVSAFSASLWAVRHLQLISS